MKKNTFLMVLIKFLSLLISFAYVPIVLNAVNRIDYGVLITLTSIVHWIAMLDVGLGSGLRNKLSEAIATNNFSLGKKLVSSCYGALGLYISVIGILFFVISDFLPWERILNANDCDLTQLYSLVKIVLISFCFQFYFNLITSIIYAFQKPAITSLLLLISQFICFIAVLIAVKVFNSSSILTIGTITCVIPPITLLVASIVLFRNKFKSIAPSIHLVEFRIVGSILSLGIKFFLLQIISIVLFQATNIIVAQSVNPTAVVEYNIAFKYISAVTILFSFVIAPVWSAVTEAYVKSDVEWIKTNVKRLEKVWLCVAAIGIIMLAVSKPIYHLWLKSDIDISYSTTALVLLSSLFSMLYQIYGTVLNGIGKVHAQMVITSILAIIYIPLSFYCGNKLGLIGVLSVNSLVFMLNYIWSMFQYEKVIAGTATGFWGKN